MTTVPQLSGQGKPLVAFYGDDFTGASENMAQFHRHGLSTFLFLRCPSPDRFREVARTFQVVGVAGVARSLSPGRMAAEIEPPLRLFRDAGIGIVQYKLCSTFDSAPGRGNLATAIAVARQAFGACFVPVFAAMPEFGRYTAFGHHFAAAGRDVHRLDRHPTMARHPATPMRESDLRLVLREQGGGGVGLVDWVTLRAGCAAALARVAEERGSTNAPVVLDGLDDDDCPRVAELICRIALDEPVLVFAAQGFAHGLGRRLSGTARSARPPVEALAPVPSLLVLSGSCSIVTAAQLLRFEQAGAALHRLRPSRLLDPGRAGPELDHAMRAASANLGRGRSIAIHTAMGPDDLDARDLAGAASRRGLDGEAATRAVGLALGTLAGELISRHGLGRVVFAGGDTSSFALGGLDPDGLTMVSGDFATGAHVVAVSGRGAIHGREVVLKGGQVGGEDIFVQLRDGRSGRT